MIAVMSDFWCLTGCEYYPRIVVIAVNIVVATPRVNPWHMQPMKPVVGFVVERLAYSQ